MCYRWGAQCFQKNGMLESRQVPTLSLDAALALAPAHLPIQKLKLDAQGLDLKLLRSASAESLLRVRSLELEVVKHGCRTLYAGQESHNEAASMLHASGFKTVGWRWHGHLKCEGTGFFTRD